MKTKHDKLSSEKNEEYYKENTRLKENKNANDHKIKQLKKEKEELCDALSQIRSIIISKVEEYIAKQIPTDRKKGHEYEAAKLLGLKAGDL
jgi:predicted nuclease with TOPRIM domain